MSSQEEKCPLNTLNDAQSHLYEEKSKVKLYSKVPFLTYQLGRNPKVHIVSGKQNDGTPMQENSATSNKISDRSLTQKPRFQEFILLIISSQV